MSTTKVSQEKRYGVVSADERRALDGLEFVQRLVTGALPLNTMARTLGYNIAEASLGRVVVTADPSGDHLNPAGTVHGGFAATLLDTCMGLAVEMVSTQRHWNSRSHFCDQSRQTRAQ